MQERGALSRKELADRWGLKESTIINYENDNVITRMPLPTPRYSMKEIMEMEGIPFNPLSPLERKRLELENEQLKRENDFYKELIRDIKITTAKVI